ncbi:MAG: SLC13/DASS family transporter [Fidelibacterota bacterium]|nr:MAG: SLC13/DASS family transporter [Candidatus Neomarinimicrobiota bacterium]
MVSIVNKPRLPFRRVAKWAGPLVALLFILVVDLNPENPATTYAAAVAVWMVIWWLTEAVPLAATAILPVVLFPILKIMPGREVAGLYFNNVIFLFLGGFIVALAMERWQLHRRLALTIISGLGSSPRMLILGFMLATAFLSMWISNTATTMMMVPIAMGALARLENTDNSTSPRLPVALLLAIAYSASMGGIATLIGTPPNLAFVRIYAITFPEATEVSFTSWFVFAFPISVIFLAITWFGLSTWVVRGGITGEIDRSLFASELAAMGPMSKEERLVLGHFVVLAVLWLTRGDVNLGDFTLSGWGSLLGLSGYVDDGTVAVLVASSLFFFHSDNSPSGRVMDWRTARNLPWHIVLLFGGGFALARGFMASGLSQWVGDNMAGLSGLPIILIVATISLTVTFLTELTSNTATAELLLPILAAVAVSINIHPLMLMVPATISASCAFMMPVATPPNAIVFGTERLTIPQMARAGVLLNFIGVALITTAILVFGKVIMP